MIKNPEWWRGLAAIATSAIVMGFVSAGAHAALLEPESGPALATGDTEPEQACSREDACASPSDPEDGLLTIQTATGADGEIIEYSLVVTLFDPTLGDGTAIPIDDEYEYWSPGDEDLEEYGPLLPWGDCLTDPENYVCPAGGPATPASHLPEPGTLACLAAALVGAGIPTRRRLLHTAK